MIAGGQGGLADWIEKFKAKAQPEAVEESASPVDSESSLPSSLPESPAVDDEQEQDLAAEAGALLGEAGATQQAHAITSTSTPASQT